MVICITNSIDSPLAQTADIRLYAAPSEVKYFQAPLVSRVTQLALADALLVLVGLRRKRKALIHLRRAEEQLLKRRLNGSRLLRQQPARERRLRSAKPTAARRGRPRV
jgi:DNA-binding MurR/RpiR family transcriptional regulator